MTAPYDKIGLLKPAKILENEYRVYSQVLGSNNLVITPIQLTMTISLGKVFDIILGESAAKAALAFDVAAKVGRTASQLFIDWIPGIGNIVNATTAAGLTETVGWIFAGDFDKQKKYLSPAGRQLQRPAGLNEFPDMLFCCCHCCASVCMSSTVVG